MPKSSFNFQDFKKLKTQKEAFVYASKHLGRHEKCGISRCMWKISVGGKELALKINKFNSSVSRQTEKEVKAAECVKHNGNFVKVVAYSPDYIWDIMELAKTPLDTNAFKQYTGIDWDEFSFTSHNYSEAKFEKNTKTTSGQ